MEIEKHKYNNFLHDEVKKKFEGNPEYVGDWDVRGAICSVYTVAEPNREKGHKDFLLLYFRHDPFGDSQMYVSGIDKNDMEEEAVQSAILCKGCDKVLWSVHRHDFHFCGCSNETFVDGGKSYLRSGAKDISKTVVGKINHLTREFTPTEVNHPAPKGRGLRRQASG